MLLDPSTDVEVATHMGPGLDTGMHNVVGTVWGTGHIGKSARVAVELSGTIHIEPRHEAGVHDMVKVIDSLGTQGMSALWWNQVAPLT